MHAVCLSVLVRRAGSTAVWPSGQEYSQDLSALSIPIQKLYVQMLKPAGQPAAVIAAMALVTWNSTAHVFQD
jgi:hypothetical protein